MNNKMKVIGISIAFVVIVGTLIYLIPVVSLLLQGGSNMMVAGEDVTYYNSIKSSINIKNTEQILLKDIFRFKWDRAYFVNSPGLSGKELSEKIGIDCDIAPLDRNEGVLRIIFMSGNEVAYDFRYDSKFIIFKPLDQFINADDSVFLIMNRSKPISLYLKQ